MDTPGPTLGMSPRVVLICRRSTQYDPSGS